jgi:hypothetical protein
MKGQGGTRAGTVDSLSAAMVYEKGPLAFWTQQKMLMPSDCVKAYLYWQGAKITFDGNYRPFG